MFRRSTTSRKERHWRANHPLWRRPRVTSPIARARWSSARSPDDPMAERSMRRIGLALMGIALVASATAAAGQATPAQPAAPAQKSSLLGTWEAITRSAGGLGATIAFGADNSLRYTLGAMVDMKYRRTRDSLYIVDPQGPVNPFQVTFVRDTMIMTNEGKV